MSVFPGRSLRGPETSGLLAETIIAKEARKVEPVEENS